MAQMGISPSHVKGIYKELYQPKAAIKTSQTLPASLASILALSSEAGLLNVEKSLHSELDGSTKFLFRLADGQLIESVLMPEKTRMTLCISSQVGCKRACAFCDTGRMGLIRNLSTQEIVSQVMSANHFLKDKGERVTNIVFMGMGEPLDNLENVQKSIQIFSDPWGLNLAPRKITLSTAGNLAGLKQFCEETRGVGIALSLHASSPQKRSRLMPINREFPIEEVLAFLTSYAEKQNRQILIQYTLIAGQNDSLEDANALCAMLSGVPVKVNIIPFNDFSTTRFSRPSIEQVFNFSKILLENGIATMVRFSKGQDIQAACGQLALRS